MFLIWGHLDVARYSCSQALRLLLLQKTAAHQIPWLFLAGGEALYCAVLCSVMMTPSFEYLAQTKHTENSLWRQWIKGTNHKKGIGRSMSLLKCRQSQYIWLSLYCVQSPILFPCTTQSAWADHNCWIFHEPGYSKLWIWLQVDSAWIESKCSVVADFFPLPFTLKICFQIMYRLFR